MESLGQIKEKALRHSVAYVKRSLLEGEVLAYSWIQGEEIVADVFIKLGLRCDALEEMVRKNKFRHTQTKENLVVFEGDDFKIRNFIAKKDKEQTM